MKRGKHVNSFDILWEIYFGDRVLFDEDFDEEDLLGGDFLVLFGGGVLVLPSELALLGRLLSR